MIRNKVFWVLVIVILISGCLDKTVTIGDIKIKEVVTEYKVVDVSLRHSEATFISAASDYVSVSFQGDNGELMEIKSNSIDPRFNTVMIGANRTYVEKHEYFDADKNILRTWETRWIAYIKEYPHN